MATSQYNYHPYHTIGAATVLLWDPQASPEGGAWAPLGKVAGAQVVVTTEQVGKDMTIKGLTQPVARRNRSKRYSVSFRMLEDANPATLDLLVGEGSAQSAVGPTLVTFSEVIRLYGEDWRELSHPYGILDSPPAGVTDLTAKAEGTGSTIPPGTYWYWVIPVVGDGPFTGAPVRSAEVTVPSGTPVVLGFTPPAYEAGSYKVLFNTVDDISSAYLAGEGFTGSPITLASHDGTTPKGTLSGAQLIINPYGSSSQLASGDYLVDIEKGLVKRIAGGGIAGGALVVVTYLYERPASVVTRMGDAVDLERYRRIRLLQLAADGPDPALWRETGIEFTLYRVNTSINDSRWPFSEEGFSEGAAVTWDALFDPAEARVGDVRSTYGVLAQYE